LNRRSRCSPPFPPSLRSRICVELYHVHASGVIVGIYLLHVHHAWDVVVNVVLHVLSIIDFIVPRHVAHKNNIYVEVVVGVRHPKPCSHLVDSIGTSGCSQEQPTCKGRNVACMQEHPKTQNTHGLWGA
jgi:hypothetical protein